MNVVVEGLPSAPVACLLDTGTVQNRFGLWVAEMAGIDLEAAETEEIALGGFVALARTVRVPLSIDEATWEAPVSFCDPWPLGFQLLGQEGFFRWFRVTLRAVAYTIDLTPEDL